MMRYIYIIIIMGVLANIAVSSARANQADVQEYLENTANHVIATLKSYDTAPNAVSRTIGRILDETLDYNLISNFLLARYARTISQDDKKDFISALSLYIKSLYIKRFKGYNGETLEVLGVDGPKRNAYTVHTRLNDNTIDPLLISWRVIEYEPKKYKIFDILVNNISMVLAQREEIIPILKEHNGDVKPLIAKIKKITASP